MKQRIIAPDNPLFSRLLANGEETAEKYGMEFYKVDEKQCEKLLFNNRADIALVNPLTYGLGLKKADFRIVPGRCLAAAGYTGMGSIYFNRGLKSIDSIGSPDPQSYLAVLGDMLLRERYDIMADIVRSANGMDTMLDKYDAALVPGSSGHEERALDITEEWHTAYELPLPIGIWVCRNEEEPKDTPRIVEEMAEDNLPASDTIIEETTEDFLDREGRRIYKVNEDIEEALEFVFHMLFYHQYLPEIPAVKILGRD
jgi:predicted solute-binding protein